MHRELLNNETFRRYYQQWRSDPTSILFAPLAEYFLLYGMTEEAIQVCEGGLKYNPDLISGRLVFAKAWMRKKDWTRAKQELDFILRREPDHTKAQELLKQVEMDPSTPWVNLTMAKIYEAQGHWDGAKKIYQAILARDPHNPEAKEGLEAMGVRDS